MGLQVPKNIEKSPTQVFVLSTGRSGSKTISEVLSAIPSCRVVHELEPKLLREVTEYVKVQMTHKEVVDLLLHTRSPELIGGKRLSGESNQRLCFVLAPLAEAFPNAKYLWLIRDGRQTVASLYNRFWYHARESEIRPASLARWASTRLQADDVGDLSKEDWVRLDRFGRCCWYWSYTNRLIQRESERLNLKIRVCKIENLDIELPEIFSFLDLSHPAPGQVPRSNRTVGKRPLPWIPWSRSQHAVFARLAGKVMDEHYPGWSKEMQMSLGQELTGFFRRSMRSVREGSRPLRIKLGMTRK